VDWTSTRITWQRDWVRGCLRTIRLAAESPEFRAGQFLNLALDLDGERVQRSYSMASAPGEPLEFYLVRVDGGRLTEPLFARGPGDEVLVSARPAGYFTLERVPDAPVLWLVATGTGLGPYVSILRTGEPWARFERVVVVHGVRERSHLAYADELRERGGERLTWVPVVSREDPPEGGLAGRLTDRLRDGALEAAAGAELTPDAAQVLLCGNPGMLAEAKALLEERGLKKNRRRAPGHVTTEAYWQLGR